MGSLGNRAQILKYKLAVAGLRNSGDGLKLAKAVRHLGDAYYYAGQTMLAEPCYVEALSIYRSHKDRQPLDLANAIRSFAVLKDELGADEEARNLWGEAHDIYLNVDVSAGVAESAARLALLARREGDLERSRGWLDEAMKAAQGSNDPETLKYVTDVRTQIES
jgi:tetratricopeptide (TPR) repeat protein